MSSCPAPLRMFVCYTVYRYAYVYNLHVCVCWGGGGDDGGYQTTQAAMACLSLVSIYIRPDPRGSPLRLSKKTHEPFYVIAF